MRQYERIWQAVKTCELGEEVAVRIHASGEKRLIQAVRLEKTKEVAVKKKVGMLRQGPLLVRVTTDTVKQDAAFIIVYFKLQWDGTKL